MIPPPDEVLDLEVLPILFRDEILLPFQEQAVHITDEVQLQLIDDSRFGSGYIGFHYDTSAMNPKKFKKLRLPHHYAAGCIARIIEETPHEAGGSNVKFKGIHRYLIREFLATDKPYPVARFKFFKDVFHDGWEERCEKLRDEICLTHQRALTKFFNKFKDDPSEHTELPLMNPDPYFLSFAAGFLFKDEAIRNKCLYYNGVQIRLEYALKVVKEFEAAVDDNIERTNLIKPFLNLPNNRHNPDLS